MLFSPQSYFTKSWVNQAVPDMTSVPGGAIALSATPLTLSAWTQISASVPFDVWAIEVSTYNVATGGSNSATLYDFGIGAASSETVLIEGLSASGASNDVCQFGGASTTVPIRIAEGERLTIRARSARASVTFRYVVTLYGAPTHPEAVFSGTIADGYGLDLANARGTTVTPGANDTWGSYAQIVASTTRHHRAMLFEVLPPYSTDMVQQGYAIQFAVGATDAEQQLGPSFMGVANTAEGWGRWPRNTYYMIDLPIGSRLSARASSSGTAVDLSVIAWGIS
jgi:hypothetical protein